MRALLLALLLTLPAEAAISYVGGTSLHTGSATVVVTYAAMAGNTVVVGLRVPSASAARSVSDSGSNTYSQQGATLSAGGYKIAVWTAKITNATSTISVVTGYGSDDSVEIVEYSGVAAVDAVVATTYSSPPSITATLASGTNYLVMYSNAGGYAPSAGAGTLRIKNDDSGNRTAMIDATNANPVAVTVAAYQQSYTGSAMGIAVQLAWQATVLGPTPARRRMRRSGASP